MKPTFDFSILFKRAMTLFVTAFVATFVHYYTTTTPPDLSVDAMNGLHAGILAIISAVGLDQLLYQKSVSDFKTQSLANKK